MWSCNKDSKRKCPMKLRLYNIDGTFIVSERGQHICTQDEHKHVNAKMFANIAAEEARRTGSSGSVDQAFRKTSNRHPDLAPYASKVTMHKTLQRAKAEGSLFSKSGILSRYKSLSSFVKHVEEHPDDLKYINPNGEEKTLTVKLVNSGSKTEHLLMYDPLLVDKFTDNEIFVDATFQVTPKIKGVKQLMSILAKKYNNASPMFWVLMTKKSEKSYRTVFNSIKELFPNFKPAVAITDYERALQNALRGCFKNIKVHGCHFHYSQAIVRNAKRFGVCVYNNAEKNPKGHGILKKVIGLAYAPPQKIEEGLIYIEKLTDSIYDSKDGKDEKMLAKWKKFFTYFRKQWMQRVKPEVFSVFRKIDRTNNYIESYHRNLNALIGATPDTKYFFDKFILLKEESLCNIERALKGSPLTADAKSATKVRDARIRAAMDNMISDTPWTVERFLSEVADPTDDQSIFQVIDLVDETYKKAIEQEPDIIDDQDSDIESDEFSDNEDVRESASQQETSKIDCMEAPIVEELDNEHSQESAREDEKNENIEPPAKKPKVDSKGRKPKKTTAVKDSTQRNVLHEFKNATSRKGRQVKQPAHMKDYVI